MEFLKSNSFSKCNGTFFRNGGSIFNKQSFFTNIIFNEKSKHNKCTIKHYLEILARNLHVHELEAKGPRWDGGPTFAEVVDREWSNLR